MTISEGVNLTEICKCFSLFHNNTDVELRSVKRIIGNLGSRLNRPLYWVRREDLILPIQVWLPRVPLVQTQMLNCVHNILRLCSPPFCKQTTVCLFCYLFARKPSNTGRFVYSGEYVIVSPQNQASVVNVLTPLNCVHLWYNWFWVVGYAIKRWFTAMLECDCRLLERLIG